MTIRFTSIRITCSCVLFQILHFPTTGFQRGVPPPPNRANFVVVLIMSNDVLQLVWENRVTQGTTVPLDSVVATIRNV